jgi:hypothetical protein
MSTSRQLWWSLLVIAVALLLSLLWSFQFLEAGSATYSIAQFNGILLVGVAIGTAILLYTEWEPF